MASQAYAFNGFVGIGHETTLGTAVPRTAFARFLDAEITRNHGETHPLTSRGLAPEDAVLGDYDVAFRGRVEARPETVGAWLKAHAGAGSVTTTTPGGAVNARQHVIVPKETRAPVTYEERHGTLNKSDFVKGGVVEQLVIEVNGPQVALGYQGVGQKDDVDQTPSTPTFDANASWAKHQTVMKVAGSAVGARGLRLTLGRQVEKGDYETGSRYRIDADVGEVMASLEADIPVRDLTLLKRSLGGTAATAPLDDPLYTAMALEITGALIESTYFQKLTVDLPRTFWKPIGLPKQGKQGLMQRIQAKVLHSTSAGYPWQATLINTQTGL